MNALDLEHDGGNLEFLSIVKFSKKYHFPLILSLVLAILHVYGLVGRNICLQPYDILYFYTSNMYVDWI